MVETARQKIVVRSEFSPSLLKAFAMMTIEFGRLERIVYLAIKSVRGQGYSEGLIHALNKFQFGKICDELERLFLDRYGPSMEANWLHEFVVRAKKHADERNNFIHSMWSTNSDGKPFCARVYLKRPEKILEEMVLQIDVRQIKTFSADLSASWRSLNQARFRRWPQLPNRPGYVLPAV
jgi:hypothetical protein